MSPFTISVPLREPDSALLHWPYTRGKAVILILALEIALFVAAFVMLHRALALRMAEAARWEEDCRLVRPLAKRLMPRPDRN